MCLGLTSLQESNPPLAWNCGLTAQHKNNHLKMLDLLDQNKGNAKQLTKDLKTQNTDFRALNYIQI